MRSFAIKEPGSPVPALYATLLTTDDENALCPAEVEQPTRHKDHFVIYVEIGFNLFDYLH